MDAVFVVYLMCLTFAQTFFVLFRTFAGGLAYTIAVRLHMLINQQFIMFLGSYFLWTKLSPAANLTSECVPLQGSFARRKMICQQDVVKALLCLFLVLTHAWFLFYFIYVGREPIILAILSTVSLAVFLHTTLFLLGLSACDGFKRLLLQFGVSPRHMTFFPADTVVNRLVAVAAAILIVLTEFWVAYSPPVIRRVPVPICNLPVALQGFSFALLTDLHIGPTVGRSRVLQVVDITNSLKPDVVVISGDLADGGVEYLGDAAEPLRLLRTNYGSYFATGNHEYMLGDVREWFGFLQQVGIRPLHNEHVRIVLDTSAVCVAGVDDLYAERSRVPGHGMDYKKALAGCESNDTVVLLAHQPNAARIVLDDEDFANKVDLILSGHTHGGQIYLFVPMVYFFNAFLRGLYYDSASATYIYVSAGVNYFGPPVKMIGACEVVLLELTRSLHSFSGASFGSNSEVKFGLLLQVRATAVASSGSGAAAGADFEVEKLRSCPSLVEAEHFLVNMREKMFCRFAAAA